MIFLYSTIQNAPVKNKILWIWVISVSYNELTAKFGPGKLKKGADFQLYNSPPVAPLFTVMESLNWVKLHTKHTNKLNKVNGIVLGLESDHMAGLSPYHIEHITELKNINRNAMDYARDHFPDKNLDKFWNQEAIREITNQTVHVLNLLERRFAVKLPRWYICDILCSNFVN